jgi:predicted flap endonuclease-1-like 5' DNA nuclease
MFQLNPLANPDAFWQHVLMLTVIGILGFLIGYVSRKKTRLALEEQLTGLKDELAQCHNQTILAPVAGNLLRADDLTLIEGIGPKIKTLLHNAGVLTWYQLSQKTPDQLNEILLQSDLRLQVHDPSTWPEQARLASNGEWERLKTWQDELKGGRKL